METKPMRYSKALNALRFFAAMWILLGHFGIEPLRTLGAPNGLLNVLLMRSVATSCFFVLSGFLLTQSVHGNSIEPRGFLTRRVSKLYPVHVFFFVALLPTAMMGDIRFTPLQTLGHAAAWLTMTHGFFPHIGELYNSSAWAVTSFVVGYIALLWTVRWKTAHSSSLLLRMAVLWVGAALPSVVLYFLAGDWMRSATAQLTSARSSMPPDLAWWMTFIHIFPGFRVMEVMFGSALAILSSRIPQRQNQEWFAKDWFLLAEGIFLVVLLALTGQDVAVRYLVSHSLLLPFLGFGMLGVWLNRGRLESVLSGAAFQQCGSSSMLIYFGHLPAGWGLIWIARQFRQTPIEESLRDPWLLLTTILVSLVPALLLWKPYESFAIKFASWMRSVLWSDQGQPKLNPLSDTTPNGRVSAPRSTTPAAICNKPTVGESLR
ncbi:MAG: acyltransferase family protein [Paludibaculum sp.]